MYSTSTDSGVANVVHMCTMAARRVGACRDLGLQSGCTNCDVWVAACFEISRIC